MTAPLRADLVGDGYLRRCGIGVAGPSHNASLATLCERLIRDGHDPELRLHIYKSDKLFERLSSLQDGLGFGG